MAEAGVYVFDLTPLTRQIASERRTAVIGFDLPTHSLKTGVPSVLFGIAITSVFTKLLGPWSVLPGMAAGAWVWWMLASRTSSGLRVKRWRAMVDRRRLRNVITVCGEAFVLTEPRIERLRTASVPVSR